MKNRVISLFFILLSLSFLILSCSNQKDIVPEKVSELLLVKTITGEEAKNIINKLHFQPVTDNENLIGYYENQSGQAIVYVTIYDKDEEAKNDFEKMTKKISPENSVFIFPQFFDFENNKIYKCFGMGMTHFVFALNNKLYWISVDTHLAKQFFEDFYHSIE
ncbi:MAG: hypothetical protein N3F03_01895 [Ignavibacteria bacterium]|nr:hypothetical protein [Ignavibacteria bacterium]